MASSVELRPINSRIGSIILKSTDWADNRQSVNVEGLPSNSIIFASFKNEDNTTGKDYSAFVSCIKIENNATLTFLLNEVNSLITPCDVTVDLVIIEGGAQESGSTIFNCTVPGQSVSSPYIISSTSPEQTESLWLDTTSNTFKYYNKNTSTWITMPGSLIPATAWV